MTIDYEFLDHSPVKVTRVEGDDLDIARAAWVSTKGERAEDEANSERVAGLINMLLRDRHGCYDAETEVLTKDGWKFWPEVSDDDSFLSLDLATDEITYQKASRIVRAPFEGDLVRITNKHVDYLVTPNHKMVASTRKNKSGGWSDWELVDAREFTKRSYRTRKGGGIWNSTSKTSLNLAEISLVGFFIGDGNISSPTSTPTFNIRKNREIEFLNAIVQNIPNASISLLKSGSRSVVGLSSELRYLLASCYNQEGEKIIPPALLNLSTVELTELWHGLKASDGWSSGVRTEYFTTSRVLAGNIQELLVKIDSCGDDLVTNYPVWDNDWAKSKKPLHTVSKHSGRYSRPRIGWTKVDRATQVTNEYYDHWVYCATVPNGTLYIRRNGKVSWCGNSPFEHVGFQFLVTAPLFVWREHMTHRIASYNEESGRYTVLKPRFYLPNADRNLIQEGKPGLYIFKPGDFIHKIAVKESIEEISIAAYDKYTQMLNIGVAKEVARMVLPVNIMSTAYVRINLRSLMNFISLRTQSVESKVPSFPQWEIQDVANQYEDAFRQNFPLTHKAFVQNGRQAP